ncbi:MAG: choice-of-anchor J domain-containing protein [Flavobacterium sp.]|nr:choice-of-anchor J domain-containing protein [Flavobacterium sp.]
MKTIQFKIVLSSFLLLVIFSSCTKDSDADYPIAKTTLFAEDFSNASFSDTGWTVYAEQGIKNWSIGSYSGNGYAQMSSYQSGQPVNVSWLISPAFDFDKQDGEKLFFQSCQDGFVKNQDNSLELFVSTDYDGTTFANANWKKIRFTGATQDTKKYLYINSGTLDVSSYTGTVHFAFKYRGTTSQSGGYQMDNFRIFY